MDGFAWEISIAPYDHLWNPSIRIIRKLPPWNEHVCGNLSLIFWQIMDHGCIYKWSSIFWKVFIIFILICSCIPIFRQTRVYVQVFMRIALSVCSWRGLTTVWLLVKLFFKEFEYWSEETLQKNKTTYLSILVGLTRTMSSRRGQWMNYHLRCLYYNTTTVFWNLYTCIYGLLKELELSSTRLLD